VNAGRLRLGPEDVWLVDEAAMIDHARYAALLEAAADAGVTVIQVGDDRQLAPVGPGGMWASTHGLAEAAGSATELRVVRRALEAREAEAWQAIRGGRVVEGLTAIRDSGRLRLYDTRDQLRAGMVNEWWQAGPARGLMMVDTSNEERDALNQLAQRRRLEAGELATEAVRFDERRELHVGDTVLFSAIYRPQAGAEADRWMKRVENGTPAIVRAVDPERREVVLELDEFDQGATEARTLRVDREAPVELGYARHVYKAQGVTRHTADMAVSLRTHLNELYVMVSRAREGARIHVLAVELEEAAEDAAEAQLEAEMGESPRGADHGPQSRPGERADRPQPAEGRQLELLQEAEARPSTVDGEARSPEGRVDLAAELREARARQQANRELATIGEIGRRAAPSTKEAVGERPPAPASEVEPPWQRVGAVRGRWSAGRDADRQDRGAMRWFTSPSLDAEAPQQARETARRAAEGKVPERRPRRTERAARSFPSRDLVESMGRHYLEQADTPKALANYEVAGKVEYTADPMARAIERLEADRHAVLVAMPDQMERVRSELSRRSELAADVDTGWSTPRWRTRCTGGRLGRRTTVTGLT